MLGLIGFAFFIYGKKGKQPVPLLGGVAMMVVPYLVEPIWLEWVAIAGLAGAVFLGQRWLKG
jgi:hypothetical protein